MEVSKITGSMNTLPRPREEEARFLQNSMVATQEVPREKEEPLSQEKLTQWVEKMNTVMEALSIEARFSIHESTHSIVVTLINRETGEVIRQIPPEKLLDMVARFQELAGLFVDEVV